MSVGSSKRRLGGGWIGHTSLNCELECSKNREVIGAKAAILRLRIFDTEMATSTPMRMSGY